MEIEGFDSMISTLTLAKELYDIDRYDIVEEHFFDTLSWDSYFENTYGVITSIFSGFYSNYDDDDETECMIFSDDCISRYYEMAWEYDRSHNVGHDGNPFVTDAQNEVHDRLSFCYSLGWKLLGYTKTKKTARQSKLVVYMGTCDCDCHDHLAYALIQLYKFFSDKCEPFKGSREMPVSTDVVAMKGVKAA